MSTIDTTAGELQRDQCYPQDLAQFILPLLHAAHPKTAPQYESSCGFDIPSCETLTRIISCAYQASLQTEEQRPVTFRLILGTPEAFPPNPGPHGLHCFEFTDMLPFDAYEIRRLSPATAYHRSLIGIVCDAGELKIWGCVHSGPRWLKALQGGRANAPAMPPALVLRVTGPGRIQVAKGALTLGQLSEGRIYGPSMNMFMSEWLPEKFAKERDGTLQLHLAARARAANQWADIDPDCLKTLGQHLIRRMLAATRAYRHGGTILWVPAEIKEQILTDGNPYLDIKYKFAEGAERSRLRALMVEIFNTLAQRGVHSDGEVRPVNWDDYESSVDPIINQLDEAVFEMSHFVANLTATDGAVVLTKEFEVLGFGAEIHCNRHEVSTIARSIDLEADSIHLESIHSVGTRHRSVYRFCKAIHDGIGQVISQDGNVRFVTWKNNTVTYWDHQAIADSFE